MFKVLLTVYTFKDLLENVVYLQVKWELDYEPYIVVKKGIPLFDHRFVGFGWNKVSHAILLDLLG